MRALVDDILSPAPRRSYFRIQCKTLLRNNAIDIVFGMIDVSNIRHDAAYRSAVFQAPYGRRVHDAEIGMPEEIAAASKSIDYPGTIHMSGIDMSVDIDFDRRIHGYDKQPGYQFRVIGQPHGAENHFIAAMLEQAHELMPPLFGE